MWFRDALNWSHASGDLLTSLCAAPQGVPEFLLARIEPPSLWCDDLCSLSNVDHETARGDIREVFGERVPHAVGAAFDDVRAGLAAVIGQLDHYVSTILDPMWLRVSMALTAEVNQVRERLGSTGHSAVAGPTVIVTTAFGGKPESFYGSGHRIMSLPVANAGPVLYRTGMPRAPLASLIGHTRTTLLYALDCEMTVLELARATGQRRENVLHHLRVLSKTNLVLADASPQPRCRYRRTALADLLLESGAGDSAIITPVVAQMRRGPSRTG
jgi:DNA-binding transcriptional ArsR family regulator